MPAVTIDEAKAHLRVDDDDEDSYIADLVATAIGHLDSIGVDVGADPLPMPVRHAILLLVGHWFENREAVVVGTRSTITLPMAVDALIAPYRSYCDESD